MRSAILKVTGISLAFSALFTVSAKANLFGNIKVIETQQQKIEAIESARLNRHLTDSLLNSIVIDSVTKETYEMFPPFLSTPRILGSIEGPQDHYLELSRPSYSSLAGVIEVCNDSVTEIIYPQHNNPALSDPIPEWFRKSLRFQNQIYDANLKMLINNPSMVEYADWNLPVPPRLPDEDFSFRTFLRKMNLPEMNPETAEIPQSEIPHRNWLHYFNVSLQLSQAYVSSNWYQGGNSSVSGLFGFTWNVDLNPVYYPKLLFQSSLQYKLAVNSNPKGSLHKYNTSQDLFQYTLKAGLKAFNHWFYSLNLLFNTQFFNAYPDDSLQRKSSFLSPGNFNLGLGMTYSLEKARINLSATISPLAYNLKTCIASDIDHMQFNIDQNRKTLSEIGSSSEVNLTWKFTDNISWKSRLFLFTNYKYFLADWENTFNFQINKVLSTQIFIHPRFDSSSEDISKWHHWMLHEILSFGISYTFATPK